MFAVSCIVPVMRAVASVVKKGVDQVQVSNVESLAYILCAVLRLFIPAARLKAIVDQAPTVRFRLPGGAQHVTLANAATLAEALRPSNLTALHNLIEAPKANKDDTKAAPADAASATTK